MACREGAAGIVVVGEDQGELLSLHESALEAGGDQGAANSVVRAGEARSAASPHGSSRPKPTLTLPATSTPLTSLIPSFVLPLTRRQVGIPPPDRLLTAPPRKAAPPMRLPSPTPTSASTPLPTSPSTPTSRQLGRNMGQS
ncbi:hypothetical protein BT69DRAFT_1330676 [Atractiella rhizophila]|nr:hypothetical protein BT69DRAFT_1330676 [Atractiella rhizophila]